MNILDAVNRLGQLGHDLNRGVLVTPVDATAECADLHRMVEALQEARGQRVMQTDPGTLERARSRWKTCRPNIDALNRREIRILCWDLDTALTPAFVEAVSGHDEFHSKRIWIEGLAVLYFNDWRIMPEPDRLEQVLRAASRQPCANKGWLSLCGKHASEIFSARANAFLARNAIERKTNVYIELARWGLGDNTTLRAATLEAAIEEWLRRYLAEMESMTDARATAELKFLFDELLSNAGASSTQFAYAVGRLILCNRAGTGGAVQAAIQTWVLKNDRLGDPRHPANLLKWNRVEPDALRRFKSWLAKEDLLFFFEFVIPDGQDPHGRKPFWLQYIGNNGNTDVIDARVVLCSKDRNRLQRASREQFSYGRVIDSDEVSAFLMRFRGKYGEIIVVEFSRPPNRVYIHSAGEFEKHVGGMRSEEFSVRSERGLKHDTRLARFTHHPPEQWQREVRSYLAGEHGIRPR